MAEHTATPVKPRPLATPTSQPFWDGLAEEKVRVQRCEDCGTWVWYPRSRCSSCLSSRLTWTDVSGAATLYTFTVARQPTMAAFGDEMPQLLAVVELEEGPRLTTTVWGTDPEALEVGMAMSPVFDRGDDGMTLLRFEPQ